LLKYAKVGSTAAVRELLSKDDCSRIINGKDNDGRTALILASDKEGKVAGKTVCHFWRSWRVYSTWNE
jgi:hypothetical protein